MSSTETFVETSIPEVSPGVSTGFVEVILGNLSVRGEAPALVEVHGAELRPVSGAELEELVARARASLRAAGVQPGDRVALLAPNSARWLAADLAIMAEGAICVPLYARQALRELAGMLADCTPVLLCGAGEDLLDGVRDAAGDAAWLRTCRTMTFDDLFAADAAGDRAPVAAAPHDPVTIIYTSGTSGEPKGVVYEAGNVDFMLPRTAEALAEIIELTGPRGRDEDRVFHYLPLCFAGSRIAVWTQLWRGNPVLMSTNLDDLATELGTADAHYFLNVPALLERVRAGVIAKIRQGGGIGQFLYERGVRAHQSGRGGLWLALARRLVFAKIKAKIGPSLEFLICGSAALGEETQRWYEMLGIPVYQVYGLTETTAIVTMDAAGRARAGWVGHAIDGVELRIGDDGELLCRGPNVFSGYWRRPEQSAEVLRDGWFHTGDRVELDAGGYVRIIGRTKNILVPSSGHNVAPEPIEERLLAACPGAAQVVVVGHGRPFLAAIVSGGVTPDAVSAALETVNAALPHYQRVRKHIIAKELFSPDNGLLTANQKLRRGAIEERYRDAIAELYA